MENDGGAAARKVADELRLRVVRAHRRGGTQRGAAVKQQLQELAKRQRPGATRQVAARAHRAPAHGAERPCDNVREGGRRCVGWRPCRPCCTTSTAAAARVVNADGHPQPVQRDVHTTAVVQVRQRVRRLAALAHAADGGAVVKAAVHKELAQRAVVGRIKVDDELARPLALRAVHQGARRHNQRLKPGGGRQHVAALLAAEVKTTTRRRRRSGRQAVAHGRHGAAQGADRHQGQDVKGGGGGHRYQPARQARAHGRGHDGQQGGQAGRQDASRRHCRVGRRVQRRHVRRHEGVVQVRRLQAQIACHVHDEAQDGLHAAHVTGRAAHNHGAPGVRRAAINHHQRRAALLHQLPHVRAGVVWGCQQRRRQGGGCQRAIACVTEPCGRRRRRRWQ